MTVTQGLIMGVVQGLTEFLPISSSGHLALARELLNAGPADDLGFEVASHAGTLLAVLLFYRLKLIQLASDAVRGTGDGRRWLVWVFIGTLPAGLVGLVFKDRIEALFNDIHLVGMAWLFTALLLTLTAVVKRSSSPPGSVGLWRSALIGVSQAVAIIPGVSRSGATIAAGLLSGVDKRTAVDFSFILSIPAIAGAILLTLVDWANGSLTFQAADFFGLLAAAASGYAAIVILLKLVVSSRFHWFAVYCAVLGAAALLIA